MTEPAKQWFVKNGFDRLYGARPMGRLIQEHLREPIAEEFLFGKLIDGGLVTITEKDDKINLLIEPSKPKLRHAKQSHPK